MVKQFQFVFCACESQSFCVFQKQERRKANKNAHTYTYTSYFKTEISAGTTFISVQDIQLSTNFEIQDRKKLPDK